LVIHADGQHADDGHERKSDDGKRDGDLNHGEAALTALGVGRARFRLKRGLTPHPSPRSPSPLKGERAGVRGEAVRWSCPAQKIKDPLNASAPQERPTGVLDVQLHWIWGCS